MAFVVTESCIQCKYTERVQVCPMNCFVEGPDFLAIDPDLCISCSICVPECPVNAIVDQQEIGQDQAHFIELNRMLSQRPDWKPITSLKPSLVIPHLPDAGEASLRRTITALRTASSIQAECRRS